MTETVAPSAPAAPVPSVFSRFVGIITAPRATFETVVRSPRTIGILALVALLTGIGQGAFSLTERGRQASLDFQVQQQERFGRTVTDEQYAQMEKMGPMMTYFQIGGTFIMFPIIVLIVSAIFYAIFNVMMGGSAEFKQVMAVLAHAWVIPTLGVLFNGIMNFVRGSIATSSANLGLLLPMLPEGSFASNVAGGIDFFTIWWLFVCAIGMSVLYKRSTRNIAIGLFLVYGAIVVGFSAVFAKR
jgi:hypothetical protein